MVSVAEQEKKRKDMVEKLWHRQKPDAGTTDAEKEVAKKKIEEILNSLLKHLTFDWNTGKFIAGKQAGKAEQPKQQAGKATASTEKQNQAGTGWTTKDLADYMSKTLGIILTAKNLRRHLRTMDEYNDGKMTHYSWSGMNDPMVKKVVETFKAKKAV